MRTKEFIKSEWLQMLILLVPFVFAGLFWDKFPDRIPTHWNFRGQVDAYSGKYFGLLWLPVVNIGLCGLFLVLPKIDPRKKNYGLFRGPYKAFRVVMTLFMAVIFFTIALVSLGYKLSVPGVICYTSILLFLVIGNYIGNIRPNWFVGIRTPWTLDNPEIWRRTHRMAGRLLVASSMVMLLLGIVVRGRLFQVLFFGYVIAFVALVPTVYSYVLHRRGTAEPAINDSAVKPSGEAEATDKDLKA
jgi:uncharacterized membrane protein